MAYEVKIASGANREIERLLDKLRKMVFAEAAALYFGILLYQPPLSQIARLRLGVLRDSDDGFLIAEEDLKLRGPSELLGTRQTGQIPFRVADLSRDTYLIEAVHEGAESILTHHPDRIDKLLTRWIGLPHGLPMPEGMGLRGQIQTESTLTQTRDTPRPVEFSLFLHSCQQHLAGKYRA